MSNHHHHHHHHPILNHLQGCSQYQQHESFEYYPWKFNRDLHARCFFLYQSDQATLSAYKVFRVYLILARFSSSRIHCPSLTYQRDLRHQDYIGHFNPLLYDISIQSTPHVRHKHVSYSNAFQLGSLIEKSRRE